MRISQLEYDFGEEEEVTGSQKSTKLGGWRAMNEEPACNYDALTGRIVQPERLHPWFYPFLIIVKRPAMHPGTVMSWLG